jgi:hypothetical protein
MNKTLWVMVVLMLGVVMVGGVQARDAKTVAGLGAAIAPEFEGGRRL